MAKLNGGRLLAKALKKQGVKHIFYLMGTHVWAIHDGCVAEGIRIIDVRHEQAGAHAAEGWAKVTGNPGVSVVTAGPGVTDSVTGIANAFQAGSPMLLLSGNAPVDSFGMGSLQDLDHAELLKSITKSSRVVYETKRVPEYVATAFKAALAGKPGPAFLACPEDVLRGEVEESEVFFPEPEKSRASSKVPGNPDLIKEASRLLAAAESPVVVAGSTVYWSQASQELQQFVATINAPLFLNAMGRGCVPPDYPLFFAHSRRFAMERSDVIMLIGTDIDFRLNYGRPPLFPPTAKVIQVDIDQMEFGHNRDVDVPILGDAKLVLQQLTEELQRRDVRKREKWVEKVRVEEMRVEKAMEPLLNSPAVPIHPLRVAKEIRDFLDKDATVIGDGGGFVTSAASVVRAYYPGHWLDPARLGCLGVGTGFALAAKLARPNTQVLIIHGDGSFGFNCMEFDTAVRHKLPFVSVIGNNGGWGGGGGLGFTRYEKIVEAVGGYGEMVEKPQDIRPALERAFASGVPAAINVIIDPHAERPERGGTRLMGISSPQPGRSSGG